MSELTQERLKELLHYNPDTGVFTSLARRGSRVGIGERIGNIGKQGYWQAGVNGKRCLLHRLAFLYMTGKQAKHQIDHINHIRTDNRWDNLREVTLLDNRRNLSIRPNNVSGVFGVSFNKRRKRWQAAISINRKKSALYWGDDFFEAVCARKSAEVKHGFHGNHGR